MCRHPAPGNQCHSGSEPSARLAWRHPVVLMPARTRGPHRAARWGQAGGPAPVTVRDDCQHDVGFFISWGVRGWGGGSQPIEAGPNTTA